MELNFFTLQTDFFDRFCANVSRINSVVWGKKKQWQIRGVEVSTKPPFDLDLVLRSTDDRLNGTPSLATKVRKLLLWLTLASMLQQNIRSKTGRLDWWGKQFLPNN